MDPESAGHVVLLNHDGTPCGTASKGEVHTSSTPLHLGFSCHVTDSSGQVLLTRRALSKRSWPGVWTNSFCGHPRPGEAVEDAVRRHASYELGLRLGRVTPALTDFRYRAADASGVVEHEVCPVFTATVQEGPDPHPEEVAEFAWSSPEELRAAVQAAPWAFSPWLVLQVPEMLLYRAASQPPEVEDARP